MSLYNYLEFTWREHEEIHIQTSRILLLSKTKAGRVAEALTLWENIKYPNKCHPYIVSREELGDWM